MILKFGDLENDLQTLAASKAAQWILFYITFLKSVASTGQNELQLYLCSQVNGFCVIRFKICPLSGKNTYGMPYMFLNNLFFSN